MNNNYHSTLSQCREENDNETEEGEEEGRRTFLRSRKASISSSSSSRTEIVSATEEEQQPLKQQKSFVMLNRHFKNGLQRKNTQMKTKGNGVGNSLKVPKVSLVPSLPSEQVWFLRGNKSKDGKGLISSRYIEDKNL